jgi:LysR family cys regulon transcriptional activator
MRLEQLRFLCEIVDRGFSVSRAAEALNTSQPGVSRQVRLLEQELKFDVLRRQKGRLVGLTEPGAAVVQIARRILREVDSIGRVHDEFVHDNSGEMVIATTHLHACFVLPPIVERFRRHYPRVQFNLLQANTHDTVELVLSGRADVGIAAEPPEGYQGLVQLPAYALPRSLFAPRNHPILRQQPLTLEKIAAYPHIAYDRSYAGGMIVKRAFDAIGIEPDIIISAIDSEVIKSYVQIGMGLAVLPTITYDRKADKTLTAIDVTAMFGPCEVAVLLHPEAYLRDYMYEFIHMIAPRWTRQLTSAALTRGAMVPPSRPLPLRAINGRAAS